jgi:hypothetical protein
MVCFYFLDGTDYIEDANVQFNLQRATEVYNLIKETGDDNCAACSADVGEGTDLTPSISKCGHM